MIESSRAPARIVLRDRRATLLLSALAQPSTPAVLAGVVEWTADVMAWALALLANAEIITEVRPDGTTAEDAQSALVPWEFHDLLFHARCRPGRSDVNSGATYRFAGRLPPLPALKELDGADAFPLHRPDLPALLRDDLPFTLVLESRVSIRDFDERPITEPALGEFLFRVARADVLTPADPGDPRSYETTSRPYPSGGACYPLELYLTIDRCDGLPAGLYSYDPLRHRLIRRSGRTAHTERLLDEAARAMTVDVRPPVVITLAARFGRVAWKYSGMAYATILKDVGALYQTMYLVAVAMGLGSCALGCGDSDLLAMAAGLDWATESAVGEFALGGRIS